MTEKQGQINQFFKEIFTSKSSEEKEKNLMKIIIFFSFTGFLISLLCGSVFGSVFALFYFFSCLTIIIMFPFYFFGARKKEQKRRERFFLKQLIVIAIVGIFEIFFTINNKDLNGYFICKFGFYNLLFLCVSLLYR